MRGLLREGRRNLRILARSWMHRRRLEAVVDGIRRSGLAEPARHPRVVVSLTTFPQRIDEVHLAVGSLLLQDFRPDAVELWLAREQFPRGRNGLPRKLLRLEAFGLTIRWCEDLRSYKKLLPALAEHPHDILVTADDDAFYPPVWLERLHAGHLERPSCVCCHRAHRITFDDAGRRRPYHEWTSEVHGVEPSPLNFFTGVGGVLYPPGSLDPEVARHDLAASLAPTADDVWLWAMAVRAGRAIHVVRDNLREVVDVNIARQSGLGSDLVLFRENCFEDRNDVALGKVLDHLGITSADLLAAAGRADSEVQGGLR